MGRDFTNFEKGLKNSLEGYEVPYNEAHWDQLLNKMEGKKAASISTLAASIVTAMILAGGAFYFASKSEKTELPNADQTHHVTISDEEGKSSNSEISANSAAEFNELGDKDEKSNSQKIEEIQSSENGKTSKKQQIVRKNATSLVKESKPTPSILSEKSADTHSIVSDDFDLNKITEIAPEKKFNEPGIYKVTLILSGTSKEVQSEITIHPKPDAKFEANFPNPGELVLENLSVNAHKCTWLIEDEHFSNDINPVYSYAQGGFEQVTLMVENEYGCTDKDYKELILPAPYLIKNTPTSLKSGKIFKPTLEGITSENVSLEILFLNSNSQLIYETTDKNLMWNGTFPDGTYPEAGSEFVWVIKVLDENLKEISTESGQFTIIP